jgi:hypothetical protein
MTETVNVKGCLPDLVGLRVGRSMTGSWEGDDG